MRVLALASYPVEAAATRYRLVQFVAPLAERGIELDVRPFVNARLFATLYSRSALPRTALGLLRASLGRLADVRAARAADVVLVQREAMMLGPPVFEWLATHLGGRPLLLDLDDATYLPYCSPTYGRIGSWLKCFGKTDHLIGWAKVVTCGNRSIARYIQQRGVPTAIVPTVVDTDRFRPAQPTRRARPVLGWVGSHSTYPYLASIFPALERLARTHDFELKLIGSNRSHVEVPGVRVTNLPWRLDREVEDFQSFDVGLYPVVADGWSAGKSGFKAIQYMAVGIPFVATPIGANAEVGEPGVTHMCADSQDDWLESLSRLLADAALRARMGAAGRDHALRQFTVAAQADVLAAALRSCLGLEPVALRPAVAALPEVDLVTS